VCRRCNRSFVCRCLNGCVRRHDGGNQIRHLNSLQVEAIQRNKPLIIVGTPGRLAELSRNGALLSHSCAILVFDEVHSIPTLDPLIAYFTAQCRCGMNHNA
jgi:superfamily II DNA/RNA helicase